MVQPSVVVVVVVVVLPRAEKLVLLLFVVSVSAVMSRFNRSSGVLFVAAIAAFTVGGAATLFAGVLRDDGETMVEKKF